MMSRLRWLKLIFLRYYRDMGLRVLLYALLSLVATLSSPLANALFGDRIETKIEFSSVLPVLTILASSMLAVSTFSLNIMVTAHRSAANSTTPRVHRLLLQNTTTQSVLAAFIGAFVYSLGTIVLYRLGFYPPEAAFAVMAITTLVVVLVVISLLRWIDHLTKLGSVEDSLQAARLRAEDTLLSLARHPRNGAAALTPESVLPDTLTAITAPQSGYLQLIDIIGIEDELPDDTSLFIFVAPGQHVLKGEVIARVQGTPDEAVISEIAEAFTFGDHRTHEEDAEFGLIVLTEIASKALSPGINDAGTAVETIHILKTLLWNYAHTDPEDEGPTTPRIHATFPGCADLLDVAFSTIARDGADKVEVLIALRQALAALAGSRDAAMRRAARALADIAVDHAEKAGLPQHSLDKIKAVPLPSQS